MQSTNAQQDAYQRKCRTCVHQKPKNENMYAKDGTKKEQRHSEPEQAPHNHDKQPIRV
jgi:hypothetical protein